MMKYLKIYELINEMFILTYGHWSIILASLSSLPLDSRRTTSEHGEINYQMLFWKYYLQQTGINFADGLCFDVVTDFTNIF